MRKFLDKTELFFENSTLIKNHIIKPYMFDVQVFHCRDTKMKKKIIILTYENFKSDTVIASSNRAV